VTSNQEFFGVSVMEAIYCGVWPILPARLSYKELFPNANYKNNFYSDDSIFYEKIELSILNINDIRKTSLKNIPKKYDWENISKEYDDLLDDLAKSTD
jgi:glycosyltransferase involved in cell wall biosynthesis